MLKINTKIASPKPLPMESYSTAKKILLIIIISLVLAGSFFIFYKLCVPKYHIDGSPTLVSENIWCSTIIFVGSMVVFSFIFFTKDYGYDGSSEEDYFDHTGGAGGIM